MNKLIVQMPAFAAGVTVRIETVEGTTQAVREGKDGERWIEIISINGEVLW